jgi:hypothetical protein
MTFPPLRQAEIEVRQTAEFVYGSGVAKVGITSICSSALEFIGKLSYIA